MAKYPNFGYKGMPVILIAWVAVIATLIAGMFDVTYAFIIGIIFTVVFFYTDDHEVTNIIARIAIIPIIIVGVIIIAVK